MAEICSKYHNPRFNTVEEIAVAPLWPPMSQARQELDSQGRAPTIPFGLDRL
jgi:hypothetical protein